VDTMRRAPVQERSAARVERMLDVCGQLIDEVGYEATTTTMIARRAEVSVGSLYQFFPDKRAVVQALAQRNLDVYLGRLGQALAGVRLRHWRDMIDVAIDLWVDLHRELPGFRVVRFGDVVDTHLLQPEEDNDQVLASRLFELVRDQLGMPMSEEEQRVVVVLIKAADAIIQYAFRDPCGDQQMIDEVKTLMNGYLALRLGVESAPADEVTLG
jgi:AcrR family transcriptional regulator